MSEIGAADPAAAKGRLNSDLAGGLAMGVFVVLGLLGLRDRTGDSWVFPRVLVWTLLVLAVMMLIKGVVRAQRVSMIASRSLLRDVLLFVAAVYGLIRIIPVVGYYVGGFVVAVVSMFLLSTEWNVRTALRSLIITAGSVLLLYLLFGRGFAVPLPRWSL